MDALTQLPVDISDLPVALRMHLLGLPLARRPGRPRTLSFRQKMEAVLRWSEVFSAQARHGQSTQHPKLQPILKQIGRLRTKNALPWRIAELSRKADQIGRYSSTEILAPDVNRPAIDRAVAYELNLSERMVRRLRSDPRMQPFMGIPPWVVRDWERKDFEQAEVRRLAGRLVTPERLDKGLFGRAVMAKQAPAMEANYKLAWRAFSTQQRLGRFLPADCVSRPSWLGFGQQWARIDSQPSLERVWINDQECIRWERHLRGRRVLVKKADQGAESV